MNALEPCRRLAAALLLVSAFAAAPAAADESAGLPQAFKDLLAQSQEKKFGVTFYVAGQTIAAVVTRFDDRVIEGRSQAHDRILIRTDRIEAIAR